MENYRKSKHFFDLKTYVLSFLCFMQLLSCQDKKYKDMNEEEKAKIDQEILNRPNEIWPTNKDENDDYYYKTSICSFPGYFSENAGSHFVTDKESVGFLKMENGVWPQTTGSVLNDEHHPIPKKLYVAWFSISEDKFYEGLFELHYDKIKEEFDKMWLAYPNKSLYAASKYNRFTDIIVGVAPKGYVIVWLSSLSQQIQIGRFQAKETKAITWGRFAGMNGIAPEQTRERYVRMYREMEKMPSSIPFGKLEQYQKKYTWKPKIVYETSVSGEKILPLKYRIQYYSGDLEYIYELYEKKNLPLSRFVPKEIIFEFNIGSKAFGGGFDIDEEDIYKAFNLLAKDNETDLELVVKLDKDEEISKIVLRNKTNEYVLKCTDVQIGAGEIDPKINPLEETE